MTTEEQRMFGAAAGGGGKLQAAMERRAGCSERLDDPYWGWCGEIDMGQTLPMLCTDCGGSTPLLKRKDDDGWQCSPQSLALIRQAHLDLTREEWSDGD